MGRDVLRFDTFMKMRKLYSTSLGPCFGTTIRGETARLWGLLRAAGGGLVNVVSTLSYWVSRKASVRRWKLLGEERPNLRLACWVVRATRENGLDVAKPPRDRPIPDMDVLHLDTGARRIERRAKLYHFFLHL
jgi:hypothetical protein